MLVEGGVTGAQRNRKRRGAFKRRHGNKILLYICFAKQTNRFQHVGDEVAIFSIITMKITAKQHLHI